MVSVYPATTHTFILREVHELRAQGFEIDVIAIQKPDRPIGEMTETDRLERGRTFAVLPFGTHFIRPHLATLLARPGKYLAGLLLALRMGNRNLRTALSHGFYFLEAVVVGHEAKRRGHTHLHSHFSSTVALLAAKIFGLDLSLSLHGPDEFRDTAAFRMREKVAGSVFVRAISHYASSQIMQSSDRRDWPKIKVCRMGVDAAVFRPYRTQRDEGPPRVLFVGRLAPVKGIRVLISACAKVGAWGGRLRLHLAGGGEERADLEKYVFTLGMERHVVFEGVRNQDELIALYGLGDVFAMASFAEGVPVVLMEAMAMGLPCAATWVNGIPELIENEKDGLLTAPADEAGLADAIGRLIEDAGLRRRLGLAGRQKAIRDYDLATNTARLGSLFREHLGFRIAAPEAKPPEANPPEANPPEPPQAAERLSTRTPTVASISAGKPR